MATAPGSTGWPDDMTLMTRVRAWPRDGAGAGESWCGSVAGWAGIQVGLRLFRGEAECRQVDADERARRREGGDHEQPPPDHPAGDPGDRAPARRPAGHR